MADPAGIEARLVRSLDRAAAETVPFRHWLLAEVLPPQVCAAIVDLPIAPPHILDTKGKRETNNSTRLFFSAENRTRYAVCGDLAEALQRDPVVDRLERLCGTALSGGFLRIEYCQDTDGFWLEPHTDIGAKLFTMLVYLSDDQGSESWGTDLMDETGALVTRVPYRANCGLIFIPGRDTWHGFGKRPIAGIRRSIIVNYVRDEWRSRHELAFPDRPVA